MRINNRFEKLKEKYQKGNLRILIIGAGALGNFICLGLASGFEKLGTIIIMDPDEVEETNLNRQILYYNAIGSKKATTLAVRLHIINPNNKYKGITHFFTEKTWFIRKPDIIMEGTDSLTVRSMLNSYANQNDTILISGGISPFAGQVVTYIPKVTSCLNCELSIDRLAKEWEKERQRQGCLEKPEASVVISNEIIGGLMCGQLYNILNGGQITKGKIKYISYDPARIGILESKNNCHCLKQKQTINTRIKGYVKMLMHR